MPQIALNAVEEKPTTRKNTLHLPKDSQQFPPLESVTKPTVDTAACAYYLNRAEQTLRKWACLENGPIRPIRINGRLAWKVADLQALLNGGVAK
ncbi:MAG: hypothetical protein V4568_12530 [Pseudomonadota bacterium]